MSKIVCNDDYDDIPHLQLPTYKSGWWYHICNNDYDDIPHLQLPVDLLMGVSAFALFSHGEKHDFPINADTLNHDDDVWKDDYDDIQHLQVPTY